MKRPVRSGGFTLIEVLMASSMVALIGAVICGALSSGLKLWSRVDRFSGKEDVRLLMERLTHDLRNVQPFYEIPFKGGGQTMSFASAIYDEFDTGEEKAPPAMVDQVGRVSYKYRPFDKTVYRSQARFADVSRGEDVPERPMLRDISSLRFHYLYYDEKGRLAHKTFTSDEDIPALVKVELTYASDEPGLARKVTEVIEIPLTGGLF